MRYWLLKSDPDEFSWQDLETSPDQRTHWDGVRNYQARNYLKDMRVGEQALFYHSGTDPQSIMGIVTIVRESYPDFTQFDPRHPHFDPRSSPEAPAWFMVDIQLLKKLRSPVTRDELKKVKELEQMILLRNSRLSVQPVTAREWEIILNLRK